MAWTEPTQPQFQSDDWSNINIVQQPPPQPVTLFQQLPAAVASPVPSVRPGHIREDLVELMMMQNAQMHQVFMNNMTMSALSMFGYTQTPEHTGPAAPAENDPEVYHHYYPYSPGLSHPVWMPSLGEPQMSQLQNISSFQDLPHPPHTIHTQHRDRRVVPPPPPPSATGTVGTDVPPATEYYEAERRQHGTEET
ncbi:proline-rich protein 29-like [Pygocentrus nattereri]|uniref:DUF4587 domain-containing protein n=1 Tax=Pygocentrus nattereri TaxID=42514 RepID=A0A3B4DUT2_PYGNA|nr:proline-rich protein 29-like [Pygocentrus nattereri]